MRFTYDPEADALNIELLPGQSARTGELNPNVFADFDANGRLLSLEVLEASASYPLDELKKLDDGADWLTLVEAAKEAKLSPTTLRNQLNAGRLGGRKVGRDWQVSRASLWTYLESRAPAGARPAHGKRVKSKGEI